MTALDDGFTFLRGYWTQEDACYVEAMDRLSRGEEADLGEEIHGLLLEQTLLGASDPPGLARQPGEHGVLPIEKPNPFTDPAMLVELQRQHVPRQVYAVAAHHHAVLGPIVTAWTDSLAPQFRGDLRRRWCVTQLDGWRIVQIASVCAGCRITGIAGGFGTFHARGWTPGPVCSECGGLGANHEWGLPVGELGDVLEQRVLARPEGWLCHAWLDSLTA